MSARLKLTAPQHSVLWRHLFPGDGCEAVVLGLCGRTESAHGIILTVHSLYPVPYDQCPVREPNRVTWNTEMLPDLCETAHRRGLSLIKIHGHVGYRDFSGIDDESDRELYPSLYAWLDGAGPHASVIMMDDGSMFGRVVDDDGFFQPLACVSLVGDDLQFWHHGNQVRHSPEEFGRRVAQTFGEGTYAKLRQLRIAVIGCSGTGSVVAEELARNCVGELVLVDPDKVEEKNLNRILNSTASDAEKGEFKVDVAKRAIEAMGMGTQVLAIAKSLFDPNVVQAVAASDIVFGCMDSLDGRYLLNKLSWYYLNPYFDLGVKLEADGAGGVDQVCGTVHYLQPGGSSLISRHIISMEDVRAAGLKRVDPAAYARQRKEGYIRGIQEDRPAVIQLNAMIASLAINELLARLHPFRIDPNSEYAIHRISLSHGIYEHLPDGEPCSLFAKHMGRGDITPLLNMPELGFKADTP